MTVRLGSRPAPFSQRSRRLPPPAVVACAAVLAVVGAAATKGVLAVFTATAVAGSNTFTAGTIDIATAPTSTVVAFNAILPGEAVTNGLVVTDNGNGALRYAISSSATNPDGKGLKDQLVLTIKTVDATTPNVPCDDFDGTQLYTGDLDSTAGQLVGDSTQGAQAGDRTVAGSTSETLCFRVSLPVGTSNTYQASSTTATFAFSAEQTANNP